MSAREQLRSYSDALVQALRPVKLLKALHWGPLVHERFLKKGARSLPRPVYAPLGFEPADQVRELHRVRRRIDGKNPVEAALRRKCDEGVELVRLLASRGTRRFYEHSVRLYGEPKQVLRDSGVDNLEIARMWAARTRPFSPAQPGPLDAEAAAQEIRTLIHPVLGEACRVRVSPSLTADAAAGASSIAVRRGARFTQRQVRALAHHEGLWHVLTSLNGRSQPVLSILGPGLANFTTFQEGGGVVSEYLSASLGSERFRELGERTLIVDMAARGADYLEVYRYLAERFPPRKATQMCERVFRGGLLTGGAPFTRDAVYQRGYLRVFNFLRHAVDRGDWRLVVAFCAGKMSLDDVPLVAALIDEGLVSPPKYLPPWARDMEALAAQVVHSLAMSLFEQDKVSSYYDRLDARHQDAVQGWRAELSVPAEEPAVETVRRLGS